MSGKRSRDKGKRGEREVINILKDAGIVAERTAPMQAGTDSIAWGDIHITGFENGIVVDPPIKGECKYTEGIPNYDYKYINEETPFLFKRKNKKEWLVTMTISTFLELFIRNENTNKKIDS